VPAALDAACRARLLEEHGQDAYHFTHDVVREVIEQDLGAARRALLHRRVATVLENTPGEPPLDRLAFHYMQGDVPAKAAFYLEKAGDQARTQYANAAAAAFYQETVMLLERLGQRTEAAQVREKWGAMLRITGQHDAALAVFDQSIAAYHAAGDLESVGRTLAETWLLYVESGTAEEGIRRCREVAELLVTRGPSPGLSALYAALAMLLSLVGRSDEQLAIADRAVDLARTAGDDELLAEAEVKRGVALITMVGRVEEGMRAYQDAVRLGEAAGGMTNLAGWYNMLSGLYLARGEVATSRRMTARGREIAEQQGNLLRLLNNTLTRAAIAFHTGEWERARADYTWVRETSRRMDLSRPLLGALLGLGGLLLRCGERETATLVLDEAAEHATRTKNVVALTSASLLLAERDILLDRPEAACARLIPLYKGYDPQPHYVDDLPVWLAWAKATLGAVDEAAALIAPAIKVIRFDSRRVMLTMALRVQAVVAMQQGQRAEAERALAEGLAVARAIRHPYAQACLLLTSEMLQMQTGMIAAAQERRQAALAIFRRLGVATGAAGLEQTDVRSG
jgi:tetratricopeptide (TPR) repeat protein